MLCGLVSFATALLKRFLHSIRLVIPPSWKPLYLASGLPFLLSHQSHSLSGPLLSLFPSNISVPLFCCCLSSFHSLGNLIHLHYWRAGWRIGNLWPRSFWRPSSILLHACIFHRCLNRNSSTTKLIIVPGVWGMSISLNFQPGLEIQVADWLYISHQAHLSGPSIPYLGHWKFVWYLGYYACLPMRLWGIQISIAWGASQHICFCLFRNHKNK